jgi:hypothetical protein
LLDEHLAEAALGAFLNLGWRRQPQAMIVPAERNGAWLGRSRRIRRPTWLLRSQSVTAFPYLQKYSGTCTGGLLRAAYDFMIDALSMKSGCLIFGNPKMNCARAPAIK